MKPFRREPEGSLPKVFKGGVEMRLFVINVFGRESLELIKTVRVSASNIVEALRKAGSKEIIADFGRSQDAEFHVKGVL